MPRLSFIKKYPILLLCLLIIGPVVWEYITARTTGPDKENSEKAYPAQAEIKSISDPESLFHVVIPSDLPSQFKDYEGFSLSFNKSNHTPNYVAWELLPSETDGPTARYNNFWQDPEIDGCPETTDYKKSGYDRGHLCPAADQKWSEKAMSDCFSLANICPQDHSLNAGAWATLEKKERKWANKSNGLIIIAGPLYTPSDTKTIGKAKVRVPSAFFKIFLTHKAESPAAIAFVYPNMVAPGSMNNYAMTIDQLEEISGYDFFSALPDDIEKEVEATTNFKQWF